MFYFLVLFFSFIVWIDLRVLLPFKMFDRKAAGCKKARIKDGLREERHIRPAYPPGWPLLFPRVFCFEVLAVVVVLLKLVAEI